jgi:hypothetical protein
MIRTDAATFLGYAKPDKVEAGQRWRMHHKEYVVAMVLQNGEQALLDRTNPNAESGTSGRVSRSSRGLLEASEWEYLGMAESADTDEQRRMTDVDVEAGLHTDAAPRVPITKKVDPKAEARRANEEAAKRLIANPPEWAYPKAWMCAVLALQERANVDAHRIFPTSGDKICAEMLTEECERAHKRQARISGVVYDPIRDVMYDAYARGMERSTPFMGRPGVKGGISTCDLGVDYE